MAELRVPSVGNHVRSSDGKKSGTVTNLVTADGSDQVVGFIVHYGWRGHHAKLIPMSDVKWVNDDNVVLELSLRQFDKLSEWTGPTDLEPIVPESKVHPAAAAD
ncbi:MAG TPA: PRC-barrel domain-containing protein [Nitrolancea sp.]